MPTIVISSLVEGWGLQRWGKWQPSFEKFKEITLNGIITFEIIQMGLFLIMVLVSALLLLKISQTFESRHNYLQAFTTMAYGFSPLFLMHLMDIGPLVHPWLSLALGILLSVWILYQGIPRVMQPDPTHTFGLFLSMIFVVIMMAGMARVLTGLYLLGIVDFHNSWLTNNFPNLFR